MGLFARLKEIRFIFDDGVGNGKPPWFFTLVVLILIVAGLSFLYLRDGGDSRSKRVEGEATFRFETDSDP